MSDEPNTGTVEAAAPENGAAPTEGAAPVTSDAVDRILSRVDDLGQQVSSITERLPTQEPGEPEPEPDDVAAILQQLGYEVPDEEPSAEEGDEPMSQRELVELVVNATKQATQAELERSLHPHLAAQHEQQLDAAFVDLESRYPKLLEEEWQGQVLTAAEQLAQQTGDAKWLEDPTFIELVHKSLLADELASQETPVTPTDEGLENPRGANPSAGAESDQDRADRIVQASGKQKLADAGW